MQIWSGLPGFWVAGPLRAVGRGLLDVRAARPSWAVGHRPLAHNSIDQKFPFTSLKYSLALKWNSMLCNPTAALCCIRETMIFSYINHLLSRQKPQVAYFYTTLFSVHKYFVPQISLVQIFQCFYNGHAILWQYWFSSHQDRQRSSLNRNFMWTLTNYECNLLVNLKLYDGKHILNLSLPVSANSSNRV